MNAFEGALSYVQPALAAVIDRPLSDRELDETLEFADVIEFRADYFPTRDLGCSIDQLQRFDDTPTILTVRSGGQGGQFEGSSESLLKTYLGLMNHVDAVDVEMESPVVQNVMASAVRLDRDVSIILSHHDFSDTNIPSLEEHHQVAKAMRPDIYKYACQVYDRADYLAFGQFIDAHSTDTIIASAMAKFSFGRRTRAFMPMFGSKLIYASAIGSKPVVDGMPSVAIMREILDLLYLEDL